jgi:hypothetical protein
MLKLPILGNSPEYAKRARMVGPNAPGWPGPRTSAEFTAPDMGSSKAPTLQNAKPGIGPQVASVAEIPVERLSVRARDFYVTGEYFPIPTTKRISPRDKGEA